MPPTDIPFEPRFLHAGDTALVVELGDRVDRRISARVLALGARIDAARLPGVVETVPTFRSLMVHYDPLRTSFAQLKPQLEQMLGDLDVHQRPGRLWTLPLCYEMPHAVDLADVAQRLKLSPERVVALHAGTTFNVYMLGFLPGHPYLGDTPSALTLPRRESPRVRVPAGSVAIAMNLCSIYPLDSPGGWHIIGRTPARIYDHRLEPPVYFAPNDAIRFEPVSAARYDDLEQQGAAGTLVISPRIAQDGEPAP